MIIRVEGRKPDRSVVPVGFLHSLTNIITTALVAKNIMPDICRQYQLDEFYFTDYGLVRIQTSKLFDRGASQVRRALFVDAVEGAIQEFVTGDVECCLIEAPTTSAYPYVRRLVLRLPYEISMSCSQAVDVLDSNS